MQIPESQTNYMFHQDKGFLHHFTKYECEFILWRTLLTDITDTHKEEKKKKKKKK